MGTGTHWLTAKRLAAHGLLLALALWSVYVWALATPGLRDRNGNLKGTDFLHLYTLGSLARAHDGIHLYDMSYQSALSEQRVTGTADIRYLPLYPPQMSMLLAPFSALPYAWALVLWCTFNALVYGVCCYAVWRACPNLRRRGALIVLLAIAFPAFFNLIAWGQTSALALACFTGTFLLIRKRRDFLAGLLVGFLIYKPQLGLAAAVVFLATGTWRVVAGAILGSMVELGAGVLYYGMDPLRAWLAKMLNVSSVLPLLEPRPYQTHGLRTFWSMILPWEPVAFGMYLVSAALILALTISIWRHREGVPLPLRYSALLLATVLVSPHLTVYDLVVLTPAILLLSDWAVAQDSPTQFRLGTLLYLVYTLPLLAPLTQWTHIQLSVIAMAILLYVIWKAFQKNSDVTKAVPGVSGGPLHFLHDSG